jgi:hypothetical protein
MESDDQILSVTQLGGVLLEKFSSLSSLRKYLLMEPQSV